MRHPAYYDIVIFQYLSNVKAILGTSVDDAKMTEVLRTKIQILTRQKHTREHKLPAVVQNTFFIQQAADNYDRGKIIYYS